jgi:hypothetical protein
MWQCAGIADSISYSQDPVHTFLFKILVRDPGNERNNVGNLLSFI